MDLSVQVAGVRFKNPILPGASELVFNGESARKVAEAGVGGIVTKTFTSPSEYRIRLRPYQFPLGRLNSTLKEAGSLYSLASPHVEDMDVVIAKNIPEIAEVCRQKSLPLIASFYERPDEVDSWKKVAKGMEKAGADMIELNFSSPTMKGVLEKSPDTGNQIIKALVPQSNIPIGAKISPTLEPLVDTVHGWVQRGLSFVTAHNAPSGIYVDVESESPFGAPTVGGYSMGRAFLPMSLARIVQILKSIDIPVFGVGGVFTWERCWSCGFCVGICPESAIVLVDRATGKEVIWDGGGMAGPFSSE